LGVRIETSAPARIDLGGGTLDIWPLYLFHDLPQTVNAAISLRARVQVETRADNRIVVASEDTGVTIEAGDWRELRDSSALRLLSLIAATFEARGVTITTFSESPAGAGLAGSSALNVACCAALAEWRGSPIEPEALLQLAMDIEARAIGVPTGLQDYRPAMYGGIAALELRPGGVTRVAIEIDPTELERRLVLCYTGEPRESGTNNWEIVKRHIDGDSSVRQSMAEISRAAGTMRRALEDRDWTGLGQAVALEWNQRKHLAPGVTTPVIEKMIAAAEAAGATAAKVCGAGGGGCLFCYGPPESRDGIRRGLEIAGAHLLDFRLEHRGLIYG
jgi:D-glycero-alpha-D-manno-heptose-7-phosphate kinase